MNDNNNQIEHCKISGYDCSTCSTKCYDKSLKYREMLNRFLSESNVDFKFYHCSNIEKYTGKSDDFTLKYKIKENKSWQKAMSRYLKKILKYSNLDSKWGWNRPEFDKKLHELHGMDWNKYINELRSCHDSHLIEKWFPKLENTITI